MPTDLGPLDRKVTFQRKLASRDAFNEPVAQGWERIAQVMASRTPVSDGERRAEASANGRVITDRFVTHWAGALAAVTGEDQLVAAGVAFDVVTVKELGYREGLEFTAAARPDLDLEAVQP